MDVVKNVPEDYFYDTLKACLLETLSIQEKKNILFKVAGSCLRCWPACWPTGLLVWSSPSCSSVLYVPAASAGHLADFVGAAGAW